MRRALAAIAIAALGTVAAAGWACRELIRPGPLPAGGALITIASGDSFRAIALQLQAAGVVRHAWLLRLWARSQAADRNIQAGEYRFDEPLSPVAVLARLHSPSAALHRITIPEGSTVADVARILAAAGFGTAEQFLCVANDPEFLLRLNAPASGVEGYLFPDTYAFSWSATPADILLAMIERFREQTGALESARLETPLSEEEMVTLASLIEKEAKVGTDRPLISAVFQNRLRLQMPLQSDPTAMYGRGGHAPTAADLAVDSPYNTYRHGGLPPGPICNPGRAALDAAVHPANVPYLYFVARGDGSHAFSRTLDEHNRAVAQYQRGVRP